MQHGIVIKLKPGVAPYDKHTNSIPMENNQTPSQITQLYVKSTTSQRGWLAGRRAGWPAGGRMGCLVAHCQTTTKLTNIC
eukprot:6065467-Heterocapsa_arctica.AAC.1